MVATDYAGPGVEKHASKEAIVHEYLASPSQANDVVHAVRAAQSAFPELSKDFVVIGHSQEGGAVWAVAQREATRPTSGYLGAITISPYTNFLIEEGKFSSLMRAAMCRGIASSFPDFNPAQILTPEREGRVAMMFQTHAGVAAAIALLSGADLLKPGLKQNQYVQKHENLTSNGGKQIKGSLLIIHGESDPMNTPATVQTATKGQRCSFLPLSLNWFGFLMLGTHRPWALLNVFGWIGLPTDSQESMSSRDSRQISLVALDRVQCITRSTIGISN